LVRSQQGPQGKAQLLRQLGFFCAHTFPAQKGIKKQEKDIKFRKWFGRTSSLKLYSSGFHSYKLQNFFA